MAYRKGKLEVTSRVRSVPLGQKRKRGRPKALGNCLMKSPPNTRAPASPSAPPTLTAPASLCTTASPSEVPEETGLRKTTRKRKRKEDLTGMSPVTTLASQARSLKPGLGASKPPKKKARNEPASDNAKEHTERVEKPKPIKCKKKSGTCMHEVVFGEHHDSKSWKVYADYVKSQKSTTLIDPTYIP